MTPLPLLAHGQYLNPECQPEPGKAEGGFGKSTTKERPETQARGIIRRYDKGTQAVSTPVAFGWIRATYAGAIEYTGVTNESRGLGFYWAVFTVLLLGGGGVVVWPAPFRLEEHEVMSALVAMFCFAFSLGMLIFMARLELFRPHDEPILFDRQHRKVYRIFREMVPGWRGLFFKPWPLKAAEYDWDLIDAEHNAEIVTGGKTAMQHNALTFYVRKSADDPTIIDFFNVGQIAALTELSVPAVWEHIRRFMEDGGPHLPRGEAVFVPQVPANLWQAIRGVLPMGPMSTVEFMASHPMYTLVFVLAFPLFGPMLLIWGIGNWLSHRTEVPIRWPEAVLQAVGRPTAGASAGGALAADNATSGSAIRASS